ncbi:MAG: hypothetical protein WDO18_13775 [Acidobacteriota bacterium]
MAGRGAQTFQKRQKEQQRKEKQQEKFAKRMERKLRGPESQEDEDNLTGEPGADIGPEAGTDVGGDEVREVRQDA